MNSLLIKTPLSNISLLLKSSERGLSSVKFVKTDTATQNTPKNNTPKKTDDPFLLQAERELKDYFAGSNKPFLTPLDIDGTPFQKSVWNVLQSIPLGGVLTYGDIAEKIQNPKASRGVGGAVGKNPLPLFIPCHRVLPRPAALAFSKNAFSKKSKTSKQITPRQKTWSGLSVGGFSAGEGLDGPAIKKELLFLEDIVF